MLVLAANGHGSPPLQSNKNNNSFDKRNQARKFGPSGASTNYKSNSSKAAARQHPPEDGGGATQTRRLSGAKKSAPGAVTTSDNGRVGIMVGPAPPPGAVWRVRAKITRHCCTSAPVCCMEDPPRLTCPQAKPDAKSSLILDDIMQSEVDTRKVRSI